MKSLLEAGADDMQDEGDIFEIYTAPENFEAVHEAIKAAGIEPQASEISMIPQNYIKLEGDDAKKMLKLYEAHRRQRRRAESLCELRH